MPKNEAFPTVQGDALTVNYLWIGPPCEERPHFQHHDIAGPISLVKQLQLQYEKGEPCYPVFFWCLAEYCQHYSDIFANYNANITVKSIEDHLGFCASPENASESLMRAASDFRAFMDNALNDESVRSRVLVKDGFSLFLLMSQAGYIMDTNVFPAQERDEDGNRLNQYARVTLKKFEKVAVARGCEGKDFFIMFSPENQMNASLKIFEAWMKKKFFGYTAALKVASSEVKEIWDSAFKLGIQKYSYKSYMPNSNLEYSNIFSLLQPFKWGLFTAHLSLISLKNLFNSVKNIYFTKSMSFVLSGSKVSTEWFQNNIPTQHAFILQCVHSDSPFYLGHSMSKLYFYSKKDNLLKLIGDAAIYSHSYFPTETIEPNEAIVKTQPASVASDYLKTLKCFTQSSLIDSIISQVPHLINCENETLLHCAINMQNAPAIEILLAREPSINLAATYKLMPENIEREFTVSALAKFYGMHDMARLIENRINQKVENNFKNKSNNNDSQFSTTTILYNAPLSSSRNDFIDKHEFNNNSNEKKRKEMDEPTCVLNSLKIRKF